MVSHLILIQEIVGSNPTATSNFEMKMMMNRKYIGIYNVNRIGRDFIIGDIHGMYNEFIDILKKLKFDYSKDRFFSVGDIIDRGENSSLLIELLDEPWFNSVLGNHEDMMVTSANLYMTYNNEYMYDIIPVDEQEMIILNGGEWFLKLKFIDYVDLSLKILNNMPYTILLKALNGDGKEIDIGISHANPLTRWKDLNSYRNLNRILWGGKLGPYSKKKVEHDINIDVVESFHGHYLLNSPVIKKESINFLNGGGFINTKMPVVQLTDKGKYINKLVMPL